MVEKIQKIIQQLKSENKPVWLAALLKMDDFVDRWSLILSAPWITDQNREEEFRNLLTILKRELDPSELITIARFGILPKESHLIEELLKRRSGTELEEEKINGNTVHSGVVIESNPDLVWQSAQLFGQRAAGDAPTNT